MGLLDFILFFAVWTRLFWGNGRRWEQWRKWWGHLAVDARHFFLIGPGATRLLGNKSDGPAVHPHQ